MIEREAGDAAHRGAIDDVGRVEPAAEPDLENAGVGGRARKGQEGGGRGDFEEARLDAVAGVDDFGEQIAPARRRRSAVPAMRMRSLKRTRCGLVKAWTLWPAASSAARRNATVEPLPLVPATWNTGGSAVLRPPEPVEQRGGSARARGGRPRARAGQPIELRLDAQGCVERAKSAIRRPSAFASGVR